SLSLADREAVDAPVLSNRSSLAVHDRPGPDPIGSPRLDKRAVAPGRDEAELLAFPLAGPREPALESLRPHLGLGRVPKRQDQPRKLFGPEHVKEIALVLLPIAPAEEPRPAPLLDDPRIVSGGDERSAEPIG